MVENRVAESIEIRALEAFDQIVSSNRGRGIVENAQSRLDTFPAAHVGVESSLDSGAVVNDLHCLLIIGVNLVGSNDNNATVLVEEILHIASSVAFERSI